MAMFLNIMIAENNKQDYQNLEKQINQWAIKKHVHCTIYWEQELYYQLPSYIDQCDLAFIDIDIPKINGLEFAKYLRSQNNQIFIIFQTKHKEYAIDGYDVNALDYLLKPIHQDRLFKRLEDVLKSTIANQGEFLAYKYESKIYKVAYRDILYIEAKGHYTKIYTINEELLCNIPISKIEKDLNGFFSSSHRSFLIHLKYVEKIDKEEVIMVNQMRLPISKGKMVGFKEALRTYLTQMKK